MSDEDRPRSLTDDRPDLVVLVPEAAQPRETPKAPEGPTVVVPDRTDHWYERREAPFIIGAVVIALIVGLLVIQDRTVAVSATPSPQVSNAVRPSEPIYTALAVPVPESYRTHTLNVDGDVDVLEVADLGYGAALGYTGNVATADGPTVGSVYSDQVFSISSPTGATIIAFMPYQAAGAPVVAPGQLLTFVGTLMPVPGDFAVMVGQEAASVGLTSGVYVAVTPGTVSVITPIPEIS